MDPLSLAMILSTVGGAVTTMIGNENRRKGERYNNQQQMREADRQRAWEVDQRNAQNQFNLDMWNRTNEYNSPMAQMERLKQAGLNPNLMYGQGNVGFAGDLKSSETGSVSLPKTSNVERGYVDFGRNIPTAVELAQIGRLKSGTNLDNANAIKALNDAQLQAANKMGKDAENKTALELSKYSGDMARAIADKTIADAKRASFESSEQWTGAKLEKIKAETKKLKQEIKNLSEREKIERFHAFLAENKLVPSDPMWARQAGATEAIQELFKSFQSMSTSDFLNMFNIFKF